MADPSEPVTRWLHDAAAGDEAASQQLARWAYAELEALAARRIRRRFGAQDVTLEPAALVNETLLKLLESPVVFANRRHYLAFVGRTMLRTLIDYHRSRSATKRGGGALHVTLTGLPAPGSEAKAVAALDLERALERLERLDPRKAEVARLRGLLGLGVEEVAEIVGVAEPTVRRDWRFARSWLAEALGGND